MTLDIKRSPALLLMVADSLCRRGHFLGLPLYMHTHVYKEPLSTSTPILGFPEIGGWLYMGHYIRDVQELDRTGKIMEIKNRTGF